MFAHPGFFLFYANHFACKQVFSRMVNGGFTIIPCIPFIKSISYLYKKVKIPYLKTLTSQFFCYIFYGD